MRSQYPDPLIRRFGSSALALAVIVAVTILLGGAAAAAGRYLITSTSQISPSVRHALRGAVGPRGPQGIPGPQGPAGASPAHSATSVPTSSSQTAQGYATSVAAGRSVTVIASCATGQSATSHVTGGGFDIDAGLVVTSSRPQASYGWTVSVTNPTGSSLSVTPWAVCSG